MSDSSDSSKPRPKTAAVPHYTVGEEIMNSVTHGVGCLLGIAGLVLLIVFAALRGGGPAHMAAAIVYGVSIILEYLASTLYHAIQPARAKHVFRIIDHSCIYLLIAGQLYAVLPYHARKRRRPCAVLCRMGHRHYRHRSRVLPTRASTALGKRPGLPADGLARCL